MRAGMSIKENDLLYTVACFKCRGQLAFPANVSSEEALMKAKTRHGWKKEGKYTLCDGCSEMLEVKKPKAKLPDKKTVPKPMVDDDDIIEL